MKKFLKFYLSGLIIVCLFLICRQNFTSASEDDSFLRFSVENELPKNQISDNTFFELKVEPGMKQTLTTRVKNLTDEEIFIKIVVSNASSSSSGIINYGANKSKLIGKNAVSIKDVLEYPTQIKLKPNEEKSIKFKLAVPKAKFDGVILGGIHLKEVTDKKEIRSEEETSLKNEYSYVYSISLKENNKKIIPQFTSPGIKFNKIAYVGINNIKPLIVDKVSISTILMEDGSDKVIDDFKFENYRLAPNSSLLIPLEKTDELPIGKYRTQTKVTYDKEEWIFNSNFEVTKENKKGTDELFDETTQNKKINITLVVLIFISFVVTTVAIYFYLNKRKNK